VIINYITKENSIIGFSSITIMGCLVATSEWLSPINNHQWTNVIIFTPYNLNCTNSFIYEWICKRDCEL